MNKQELVNQILSADQQMHMDYAVPQPFVNAIQQFTGTQENPACHFVWLYDEKATFSGRPVALDGTGRYMLRKFNGKYDTDYPVSEINYDRAGNCGDFEISAKELETFDIVATVEMDEEFIDFFAGKLDSLKFGLTTAKFVEHAVEYLITAVEFRIDDEDRSMGTFEDMSSAKSALRILKDLDDDIHDYIITNEENKGAK